MQGQLHAVVQPAQSDDGVSIQGAGQDALPAIHQVIRHRPAFNMTVTVRRQQPGACAHVHTQTQMNTGGNRQNEAG